MLMLNGKFNKTISNEKGEPMKRLIPMLLFILVLGLVFTACTKEEGEVGYYEKISAEDAKTLMVDGNIILDVRTIDEFESGHIPGAINLPLASIEEGDYGILEDQSQIILVYCRSGNRSSQASKLLAEAGYTKIYDFGGISDWPYDIE